MAERTEVVFVDGVRTPFGRAGEKGQYWNTRADDLIVKAMIGLLERNPKLPKERIDDVAIAASTQTGDQGLTIGRTAAILAGLPLSVPGYAIDRMCAGAMTSVTTIGSAIGFGAYDIGIAGGVEHMGRHPMGAGADPNPRFLSEKLVSPDALNMGTTAERLHDRFPTLTKERSDRFGLLSQQRVAAAYAAGKIQPDLIPVAINSEAGWGLATEDEGMRPDTTMEGLATLKTPFRPHGRVTAGNASPLTDGATVSLLASEQAAKELGLTVKMKMVSFGFAGVAPEVMGIGPIPSTEKALHEGRTDDRRHRRLRTERGVRRAGAVVPRPLRHRRRGPAGQPVGRRDRDRPPARRIRRSLDDAARGAVRRAARCALRPHRHVRRARSGRQRHLGEPALTREPSDGRIDRLLRLVALDPDEVVTHSFVRDVTLPSGKVLALVTLDNGRDHTRPNTLGPATLLELRGVLEELAARAAKKEIAAVGVTGKPFILAAGADLSKVDGIPDLETGVLMAQLGHETLGKLGDLGVPSFVFVNGLALGGGVEIALNATYRTIDSSSPGVRAARGLPRPHPRLGRRLDPAQPDRHRERSRGHDLEPAEEQPDAEGPAGVRARYRRRNVRSRELPRGLAAWADGVISGTIKVKRKNEPGKLERAVKWDIAIGIAEKTLKSRIGTVAK